MTRIEVQGGGIIDNVNASGTPGTPGSAAGYGQKTGYGPEGFFGSGFPGHPVNQLNSAMAMTISNSTSPTSRTPRSSPIPTPATRSIATGPA